MSQAFVILEDIALRYVSMKTCPNHKTRPNVNTNIIQTKKPSVNPETSSCGDSRLVLVLVTSLPELTYDSDV